MSWKQRAPSPALVALRADLEARYPGLITSLADGRPSELSRRYFLTTAQIARLRAQLYVRDGEEESAPRARPSSPPRTRRARTPVALDLPTLEPLKRASVPPPDEGPDAVRRDTEARWPGLVEKLDRVHDGGLALLYGLNASRVAWIRLTLGIPRPPRHPPHPGVWAALEPLLGRMSDRAIAEGFQVPEAEVRRLREARGDAAGRTEP